MRTHMIWLGVAIAALVIGTVSATREVRVIEKPVEAVRTKEVSVEKPAERTREGPGENEKTGEKKLPAPLEIPQNYVLAELFFQSYSSASQFGQNEILKGLLSANVSVAISDELKAAVSATELTRTIEARLKQNGVPISDTGKTLLFDFSGVWNQSNGTYDFTATVSLLEGVNILRPGGFRATTLPVWHFVYPGSARKTNLSDEVDIAAERLVAAFSNAFLAVNPR